MVGTVSTPQGWELGQGALKEAGLSSAQESLAQALPSLPLTLSFPLLAGGAVRYRWRGGPGCPRPGEAQELCPLQEERGEALAAGEHGWSLLGAGRDCGWRVRGRWSGRLTGGGAFEGHSHQIAPSRPLALSGRLLPPFRQHIPGDLIPPPHSRGWRLMSVLAKVKQTRKESDVQLWLTVEQAGFGGRGLLSSAREKQAAETGPSLEGLHPGRALRHPRLPLTELHSLVG